MTNKELLKKLATHLNWSIEETEHILDVFNLSITSFLVEGDSVNIPGLGSFETQKCNERISVNPQTKVRYLIPPKIKPTFKPGYTIKVELKKRDKNE